MWVLEELGVGRVIQKGSCYPHDLASLALCMSEPGIGFLPWMILRLSNFGFRTFIYIRLYSSFLVLFLFFTWLFSPAFDVSCSLPVSSALAKICTLYLLDVPRKSTWFSAHSPPFAQAEDSSELGHLHMEMLSAVSGLSQHWLFVLFNIHLPAVTKLVNDRSGIQNTDSCGSLHVYWTYSDVSQRVHLRLLVPESQGLF